MVQLLLVGHSALQPVVSPVAQRKQVSLLGWLRVFFQLRQEASLARQEVRRPWGEEQEEKGETGWQTGPLQTTGIWYVLILLTIVDMKLDDIYSKYI